MTKPNTSNRRRERRITHYVNRMSAEMTCFIALWPDLTPKTDRECRLPWRLLKKRLAKRIESRQFELRLDVCAQTYLQAQQAATTPEEHARIHEVAMRVFPEFPALLKSLYGNYNNGH